MLTDSSWNHFLHRLNRKHVHKGSETKKKAHQITIGSNCLYYQKRNYRVNGHMQHLFREQVKPHEHKIQNILKQHIKKNMIPDYYILCMQHEYARTPSYPVLDTYLLWTRATYSWAYMREHPHILYWIRICYGHVQPR